MWLKSFFTIVTTLAVTWAAQAQICIPTVTVQHGVAVNIGPFDSDGDGMTDISRVQVHVRDLVIAVRNHCDNKPLQYRIRKSGQGVGMPADTVVTFNCTELGQQYVEVWVRNSMGRVNWVTTYILVQDNTFECGDDPHTVSTSCSPDALGPRIFVRNGLRTSLRIVGDNPPSATVHVDQFVETVRDNCDGPLEYRMRKYGQGTGVPSQTEVTFNCSELGMQGVEIWAVDASGNWGFSFSYVIVETYLANVCDNPPPPLPADCTPDQTLPYLVLRDGIAQSINHPEGGKRARVYAQDFIVSATDECSDIVDIRIRKAGQGTNAPPPGQTNILFNCAELGQQDVEIWVMDAAGNWTFVLTYVIIQDNDESC